MLCTNTPTASDRAIDITPTTGNGDFRPSNAALDDGGFVSVRSTNTSVLGQVYDDDGHTVGAEFEVIVAVDNFPGDASVTVLADGSFIVGWIQSNGEWPIINNQAMVRHYTADGTPEGPASALDLNDGKSIYSPLNFAALPSGGYIVNYLTDEQKIAVQLFDSNDTSTSNPIRANTISTGFEWQQKVAVNADGSFVVVWSGDDTTTHTQGVFGQRFDAHGVRLGGQFTFATSQIDTSDSPEVTYLNNGNFVVSWVAFDGDFAVKYQVFQSDGTPIGANTLGSPKGPYDHYGQPSLAALPDGGFILTWLHDVNNRTAIEGQRFDNDGSAMGDQFATVGTFNAGYGTAAELTVLENGDLAIFGSGYFASNDGYDLFARIFEIAVEIRGTSGNDTMSGTFDDDWLTGQGGNDKLTGLGGEDCLFGGNGNDVLAGWGGNDHLSGDGGNDRIIGGGGNDLIYGGKGIDIISGGGGDESINGGNGADKIFGHAGDDIIAGGRGADIIRGGNGSDNASGGGGADKIFGNAGKDILFGENGNDRISGGNGDDELIGGNGSDVIYGGKGSDILFGNTGTFEEIDTVSNKLFGGTGDDILVGNFGDDLLVGGRGNDRIFGLTGQDRLIGGSGSDTFIFWSADDSPNNSQDRDVITDFAAGTDKIDLSVIGGTKAFTFTDNAAFSGSAMELNFSFSGGSTIVWADIDGDRTADFSLELTGSVALSASDFIL